MGPPIRDLSDTTAACPIDPESNETQILLHLVRTHDAEVAECQVCSTKCEPMFTNVVGTAIYGHVACGYPLCRCEAFWYPIESIGGGDVRQCDRSFNDMLGHGLIKSWGSIVVIAYCALILASMLVIKLEVTRVRAAGKGASSGPKSPGNRLLGVMTQRMQLHAILATGVFFRIVFYACENFIVAATSLGSRSTWPPELSFLTSNGIVLVAFLIIALTYKDLQGAKHKRQACCLQAHARACARKHTTEIIDTLSRALVLAPLLPK